MAQLHLKAEVDLLEIWDFILQSGGIERADAFIDRLQTTFSTLDSFPDIGRARANLAPGLRSIPEGSYLIFYRPTSSEVEIVRVLHGARDLEALLDDEPDTFR
ncbi:MAG: type II toxin-antitoxin system RelE/ParE family toxin [Meiothermus sp.]|nr:type II toxin-antitoxin system RelE/ParE family toxin [Meiothermus sp.]